MIFGTSNTPDQNASQSSNDDPEMTSTSGDDDQEMTSSSSGSSLCNQDIAWDKQMEMTSESVSSLEDDDIAPSKRPKLNYTQRRRFQGHSHPSVPVQRILTNMSLFICQKAAQFIFGVGCARVQRVLHGKADGRTHGHRHCGSMFDPPLTSLFLSPANHNLSEIRTKI